MAFHAGESVVLRARFRLRGVVVTPTEPVHFYVRKRTSGAERQGPLVAVREEATGDWIAKFVPPATGRYDYSVETADGSVHEDNFYVRKRRS